MASGRACLRNHFSGLKIDPLVPRSLEQHIVAIFAPRQPLFQKGALSGLSYGHAREAGAIAVGARFRPRSRFLSGPFVLGPSAKAVALESPNCPAGGGAAVRRPMRQPRKGYLP